MTLGLACYWGIKICNITEESRMSYKKKKSQRSNEPPTCSVDCHNFAEGACAQFVLCQHTELVLRPRLQPRHHQPGLSTRNWHRVPVVWTEVSSLWPEKKRKNLKLSCQKPPYANFAFYFPPWGTWRVTLFLRALERTLTYTGPYHTENVCSKPPS